MKILKIDHIGIAVNSIENGKNFWTGVLGLPFEGDETVAAQKVRTAFFPVGQSEVELLESTAPDGPVAKFIEKKGEGIQHIAFPRMGAGGAKIAFLHPSATSGVLVELCQR